MKTQIDDLQFSAADVADRSAAVDEFHRRRALAQRKPVGPEPKGYCLACGEPFSAGDDRRWCDATCRDDWEDGLRI